MFVRRSLIAATAVIAGNLAFASIASAVPDYGNPEINAILGTELKQNCGFKAGGNNTDIVGPLELKDNGTLLSGQTENGAAGQAHLRCNQQSISVTVSAPDITGPNDFNASAAKECQTKLMLVGNSHTISNDTFNGCSNGGATTISRDQGNSNVNAHIRVGGAFRRGNGEAFQPGQYSYKVVLSVAAD